MVKRNEKTLVSELEKLNEKEKYIILNHISELLNARLYQANAKNTSDDSLIGALSDTYENRRARQVFEWEKVRRSSVSRQRSI